MGYPNVLQGQRCAGYGGASLATLPPYPFRSQGTKPAATGGTGKWSPILSCIACKNLLTVYLPKRRGGRASWPFFWYWYEPPPCHTTHWGCWISAVSTWGWWTRSVSCTFRRMRHDLAPNSPNHTSLKLPTPPERSSGAPLKSTTYRKCQGTMGTYESPPENFGTIIRINLPRKPPSEICKLHITSVSLFLLLCFFYLTNQPTNNHWPLNPPMHVFICIFKINMYKDRSKEFWDRGTKNKRFGLLCGLPKYDWTDTNIFKDYFQTNYLQDRRKFFNEAQSFHWV